MGSDTNIVTLLTRAGEIVELDKLSKRDVADKLLDAVVLKLAKRPLSELS